MPARVPGWVAARDRQGRTRAGVGGQDAAGEAGRGGGGVGVGGVVGGGGGGRGGPLCWGGGRAGATQAVVNWSSWKLGFGCRFAGERCRPRSCSYCARHIDSRRRAVDGGRSTSCVPRNRKMSSWPSGRARLNDTAALIRSGNRKVGQTLASLLRMPCSQAYSSIHSLASMIPSARCGTEAAGGRVS